MDRGQIHLDQPAADYWPAFAANGKGAITIRQLLTHTSGLRPGMPSRPPWSDYDGAMEAIAMDHPVNTPGTQFSYSDVNFITLGEIVHRVSHMPLNVFCKREVFEPLGMKDTSFLPSPALKPRIAPTDYQGHGLRWGQVSDPTSYHMGGVAGHAGVFSTADDLALLAQMLVNGGEGQDKRLLSAGTVAAMTKAQRLPGISTQRGLGWDIRSPYSRVFNAAFPAGSFGHTGYTGTAMWIDPASKTFMIILTSRLHPNGHGNVKPLRAKTAAAVAAAVPMGPPALAALPDADLEPVMTGYGASDRPDRVRPGIEVLAASGFAPLVGKRIGVITNHTGIDASGRSTLNLLLRAPGVKVRAIFSPEHGLSGQLDEKVASGKDASTGLPVYSLYGKTMRPTAAMLRGLDALVYDIQDVGVRFYTYITTMAYAMEAAAGAGLDFYVLDRPDPITATMVQGPVLDPDLKSFIGYFPLPVRYGMTAGELAQLFNKERGHRGQIARGAHGGISAGGLARPDRLALGQPVAEPPVPDPGDPLPRGGHDRVRQRQRRPGNFHALRSYRRSLDFGRTAGPLFERAVPPRGRLRGRDLHPRGQPLRPPSVRRRPGEGGGPGRPGYGGPGGRVGRGALPALSREVPDRPDGGHDRVSPGSPGHQERRGPAGHSTEVAARVGGLWPAAGQVSALLRPGGEQRALLGSRGLFYENVGPGVLACSWTSRGRLSHTCMLRCDPEGIMRRRPVTPVRPRPAHR